LSDFKTLGAFFCNFPPPHLDLLAPIRGVRGRAANAIRHDRRAYRSRRPIAASRSRTGLVVREDFVFPDLLKQPTARPTSRLLGNGKKED
jgi:hypothetical protein